MAKKSKLLDAVVANLPGRGPKPLMARLPPDVFAELDEVRAAFRSGVLAERGATKTGLSRELSKHLRTLGHSVGVDTVARWLAASD